MRVSRLAAKVREAGIMKPVQTEKPQIVCITPQRMVEIIDSPEGVKRHEVKHIQECAACTAIILSAAKID